MDRLCLFQPDVTGLEPLHHLGPVELAPGFFDGDRAGKFSRGRRAALV